MSFSKSAVCVDLDGTVANVDHRHHHVQQKPKNWPAFERGMKEDTPYDDIIRLVDMFYTMGYVVFFATGRHEKHRAVTESWLKEFIVGRGIFYEDLLMRDDKDSRADYLVKPAMLQNIESRGYNIAYVLEDRDRVVQTFRELGYRVLQVKEGGY